MSFLIRLTTALLLLLTPAGADLIVGGRTYQISPVEMGSRGEWVLYPAGRPRTPAARRWLSRRVLVEFTPGQTHPALSRIAGVSAVKNHGRFRVLTVSGGPDAAVEGAARLALLPGVLRAEPLLARQLSKRLIPNDPYFSWQAVEPGYQWHLRNTGQNGGTPGIDLNVAVAWDQWRGSGVTLGVVDDGLETTHPDLAASVDTTHDYDFNDADGDPGPDSQDNHGTACAGLAAAAGNNSQGISGSAPEARLAGLRLIAAPTTDDEEANAFVHAPQNIDIKSNSWGPGDDGTTIAGPGILSRQALATAVTTGRGGLGTVFIWAAGNGRQNGDDSNYDGWANTPESIAVSAIGDMGKVAAYSEPGSNILVCAPSSGGGQSITTTDLSGPAGYNPGGGGDFVDAAYTNRFGGTSAACPLAAGVTALMLQANPGLGYRDVQEILVRTARRNDPNDRSWITNGAGFSFNVNYGAGLVDATAATAMAVTWVNLPARETRSLTVSTTGLTIPDSPAPGVSQSFIVTEPDNLSIEHVTVQIDAIHPSRGDLEWSLTSPSGVTVRLARSRPNDTEAGLDWTFMATHFRGERSLGEWKLRVIDLRPENAGTRVGTTFTFSGTAVSGPLPPPVITSSTTVVGREGASLDYQLTASNQVTQYGATGLPEGVVIDSLTGRVTGEPLQTGSFAVSLSATNASGSTNTPAVFYILAADPALAEAVEQPPSTKLVPFGDGVWSSQSNVTHDGIDAAQSGTITHNELCGMEMTVTGPATLSFRWKVSSEADYDHLILVVDGVVRAFTSGEQDWAPVTVSVGSGMHNVDFDYLKDNIISNGADAGWVDQLTITPITTAPVITATPATGYVATPFTCQINADGAPTAYAATGLPSGLTLAPATGHLSGTPTATGSFAVNVSASNDFGTGSATLNLTILSLSDGLANATDAPTLTFRSPGPSPWSRQTTYRHDKVDAARSGAINNLDQSVMSTLVRGPATGSFYWGISSEPDYDFLRFSIDGAEQAAISGETGWTRRTFTLGPGEHQLKWAYQKDDFVKSGLDAGFVDEISLVQDLDSDGFARTLEAWFGTSDDDPDQQPITVFGDSPGLVVLSFPSVAGNSYRVEGSDDLVFWMPLETLTATGPLTSWTDPGAGLLSRRFYKIVVP